MKNDRQKSFKLKNITISIPIPYEENLKKLQDQGFITSRSAGIRTAVKDFLDKELENAKLLGYKMKVVKEN